MDIELFEEQYSSIRETQRRQTQLICFKNAQNSEEMSGRVDVVPECPETVFEFVVDSDSGLWRSHLDTHRMKHTADEPWSPGDQQLKSSLDSRKFSAPAGLSRQPSFGSYRSTPVKHYPFPQKKSLRKSETARRLGLYASL